ncbi:hypothetical protein COOONC_05352 [Cooperia oncophora]
MSTFRTKNEGGQWRMWPNNQDRNDVRSSTVQSGENRVYLAARALGDIRKTKKNDRSTHFMLTRSKAKLSSSLTIVTIIFTALLSPCSASDVVTSTRCPRTVSVATRIIYGESSMAWKKVSQLQPYGERQQSTTLVLYPLGHIHIPIPLPPNSGYCENKCFCPKWARTCSSYSGQHKEASQANKVPSSIFYKPPHVCSFYKSSMRSSSKKVEIFYHVELYDGTITIVPEIGIMARQFFNKEDYYCFCYDEKLVPNLISVKTSKSGSPAFCRYHTCLKPTTTAGSVFCTYYTPITALDNMNSSIGLGEQHRKNISLIRKILKVREAVLDPKVSSSRINAETTNTWDVLESCSASTCIFVDSYHPTRRY